MATQLRTYLKNSVRGYASLTTRLAKELAPNKHLQSSIKSTVEANGEDNYIIRVRASGPDARAREYGSGVWARRGPKGKILIVPKNAKALVFPWDVPTSPVSGNTVNENVPRLPDGRVMLKRVEHPGVDAANDGQGYLHPAINEVRKTIRERLKTEGAAAIKADIRISFRTKT